MSLFDCIERAIQAGEMDEERGSVAQELYRRLEAEYAHLGPDAAAATAQRDVQRVMREQAFQRRRLVLKQIQTMRRLAKSLDEYRNLHGHADAADAIPALLEFDQATRSEAVQSVRSSLRGRYHRTIADFLQRHGRDVLGRVRRVEDLGNVVRELFNEGTGDRAANALARAITRGFETARRDFNAAGGHIGRLEDFGLPHSHDAQRIAAVGFRRWAEQISDLLDWERIPDFDSGRTMAEAGAARRAEFLQLIYEDITTDGWSRREPSFRPSGRALYNRRADHRVLHFASADGWLAYNEEFGRADPFATIVTHLDGLARDTALMRVLGPNPSAGLEFASQYAERRAKTAGWELTRAGRLRWSSPAKKVEDRTRLARNMLAMITGEANRPGSDNISSFLAGTRHVLTSAQLGGAMLSAVSDTGFQAMAARHLGMAPGRVIARHARLLASEGARDAALRSGVIADQIANVGVAQARFMGEAYGPAVAERLSEATMRLSGLTHWTETGRHAFQLEMFGFLAENAGRRFDELPEPLRRHLLEARGFSAADWDAIRATELHRDPSGATFLVPDDIRHRTDIDPEYADGLALRLMAAIQEQTEFAVPTTSLRGRAMLMGGTRPGTFLGELARSGLMYKSFALSLAYGHLRRVFLAPVRGGRAANVVGFFAMTTLMGAASLQLKEVAKGRDPQDMTTLKFAGAALMQGGGLGIFGDFFRSTENRFGGGIQETLLGPMVGAAADVKRLTYDNVIDAINGRDPNVGRDVVRTLRQYTPLAGIWYYSLALQRYGFDQLQIALDPEAERAFRRAAQRRERESGNAMWWTQGALAPSRPPSLESAIGGEP